MSAALKIEPHIEPKIESSVKYKFISVDKTREEIITSISAGDFQNAVQILKNFSETDFSYPKFKLKTERFLSHAIDIILALEANKKFLSKTPNLTHSKQQELRGKYNTNFEDLKNILNKVEYSYHQLRAHDNRSTTYVIRAAWISTLVVALGFFAMDTFKVIAPAVHALINSGVDSLSDMITKFI